MFRQSLEYGLDFLKTLKRDAHAFSVGPQLSNGLGPSQHKFTESSNFLI